MEDPEHAAAAVVAVDVGGTTIKTAVVGPGAAVRLPPLTTPREDGPDAVVDAVMTATRSAVAHCLSLGHEAVGVGAAALGIVDDARGVAVASAAVGWSDVPLAALLADAVGLPTALGHDVRAAAAAEAAWGAAAGATSALFVPIGTGIAAAVVLDGQVVAGASNCAGEIGQLPLAAQGMAAGGLPTVEVVASARAIGERYAKETGAAGTAAREVAALVADGDAIAALVWNDAVEVLAHAFAAAVCTVDPAVIVVGGGLAEAGDVLLAPLTARLGELLAWRPLPPVVRAAYGADAALAGAALLAWERAAGRDRAELATMLAPGAWAPTGD